MQRVGLWPTLFVLVDGSELASAMATNGIGARIEAILAPSLRAMGYAIVRVQLSGSGSPTIQVMIEREDGAPIGVEDCAACSHAASALLDVEDPVQGTYQLEVSSPGIDRPLTRPGDYERFKGLEARIDIGRPVLGRRRFRGRLLGLTGDKVRIEVDGEPVELTLDDIQRAKLVLTPELIAAHRNA
jgi:ribosome maturation factor RimP